MTNPNPVPAEHLTHFRCPSGSFDRFATHMEAR